MPTIKLTMPNGETVSVIHATNSNGVAGSYFNGKRLGFFGAITKQVYENNITNLKAVLISEIEASGIVFDTVVRAPSDGTDADPYYHAIVGRWPVRDITANFGPKGAAKAMQSETSIDDMVKAFPYNRDGREADIRSILIVDESVATGKTAAAIIERLIAAGMSKDARVTIAACVKMG